MKHKCTSDRTNLPGDGEVMGSFGRVRKLAELTRECRSLQLAGKCMREVARRRGNGPGGIDTLVWLLVLSDECANAIITSSI